LEEGGGVLGVVGVVGVVAVENVADDAGLFFEDGDGAVDAVVGLREELVVEAAAGGRAVVGVAFAVGEAHNRVHVVEVAHEVAHHDERLHGGVERLDHDVALLGGEGFWLRREGHVVHGCCTLAGGAPGCFGGGAAVGSGGAATAAAVAEAGAVEVWDLELGKSRAVVWGSPPALAVGGWIW